MQATGSPAATNGADPQFQNTVFRGAGRRRSLMTGVKSEAASDTGNDLRERI